MHEECVSVCVESRPAKNFSATQGRSAGVSRMEKSRPSVIHLRQLSSLAPSGAALSLLLAFLPRSPPLKMVRCGEGTSDTHVLPVEAYGPFALPPHSAPGSSEAQVIHMDPDLLPIHCISALTLCICTPYVTMFQESGLDKTQKRRVENGCAFWVMTVPRHARQCVRFPFSLA